MLKIKLIKILVLCIIAIPGEVGAQDLPESQYFDSNGSRIHFIEQGSGEAVILMHGNTGSVNGWLRAGVYHNLAEDYRVIAFDARGHGKSDKPHDVSAYGAEMSQDIIRLLDHLGIEKAHIIGYSMGTRVLGHLMASHADRFLTATLGGFAPKRNWTSDDQKAVEKRYENLIKTPPQRLLDEGQDIQALATLVLGFSELTVTDKDLSNFQIPTVAIIGSKDPYLSRVNDLKALMPKMKVVVIDGATHRTAHRRPEFVEAARAIMADHRTKD